MIFHSKNVVVTGGANGIGLAISKKIAAAGGSVWIFDLESEYPVEAAQSVGSRGCIADVTDRPSLESAFDKAGVPDVLVVNAVIGKNASLFETTVDLWNQTPASVVLVNSDRVDKV
jgi:NAD(P)-dependent dehydrogenase (short-subunit alcohol dehydrogenase family)